MNDHQAFSNLAGGLTVGGCNGGGLDRGHVGAQTLFSAGGGKVTSIFRGEDL